ncbi:MAG: DNA-directed RNA polymerase subunit beta [Candidatus Nomurabacteria bacterium]|nr:DNA-directed RNA polymerase subunit beta [Candidatus Nomurabacteria bacterium]
MSKRKEILQVPDLIEHHTRSWANFITTGLAELLAETGVIEDYSGQKLTIRLKDFYFKEPRFTDGFALANELTYAAPLHVNVELINKVTGETKEQDIFFGDYPWMTERASFIINGTERVVVSQLVRSAGVLFTETESTTSGKHLYGAKVVPNRGAWLEFETAANGAMYVRIDRKKRIAATTLLRAIGFETNEQIREQFVDIDGGELSFIAATLDKDTSANAREAYMALFKNIRPGDHATAENAKSLIDSMFFDPRRYDLSRVGRYKLNRRLGLTAPNDKEHRILAPDEIVAILREIVRLNNTQEPADDVDSLANRRVRLVGELLERSFRIGLMRLHRNALDRMSIISAEEATPSNILNPRPVVAAVREFFTSSQLSQMMDETNPYAALAHKRRLSTMGPGGLTRERAGLEVRDLHPSHYGRICLIETPEGGSVGLVLYLAMFARINEYGFIEEPYRKVVKGKITDEVIYLDADEEFNEVIADAKALVDASGRFIEERIGARKQAKTEFFGAEEITLIDASNAQILGSSAAMIPFVERNRIDRALTGSSMQKQAVPLLTPVAPAVGTGVEKAIARATGSQVVATEDGEVVKADGNMVEVKSGKTTKQYPITHFRKSNDDRAINQKVVVVRGQKVAKGDILAEGASTAEGEIALGANLLVAFMPWHGYNMDDAVIVSRRLVEDDTLTSINIKDVEVEIRNTKLGPEIMTRDIPNASEHALRHLDENGVVRVGAEVEEGDVLVGRITPKGEQDLSSEERLLRAIFGEKAKDVKDTSERFKQATSAKVIDVKIFTAESGHEMKSDVLMKVKIYIAEMRKIGVGDKMAGRHGNKGVVSRVLPVEDMPYLADGTPVDILLSPMGVPSRMNLGQIFETHLGLLARALDIKVAVPSYDNISDAELSDKLEAAKLPRDGRLQLFDGLTGEAFLEPVTVGVMHMIKLHHMVDDKMHARSIGPYTMVTQQPLGGKAQNGGQRFGEMEVWALEAYGAAAMLQEMLTIKSDDVIGRAQAYEAIVKSEPIASAKLPEGFNVLVKELQALGLKVDLLSRGAVKTKESLSKERAEAQRELEKEKAAAEAITAEAVAETVGSEVSEMPNEDLEEMLTEEEGEDLEVREIDELEDSAANDESEEA